MIELSNVSLSFGNIQVLKSISLSVAERERVAIIGKNGSGKTTLALLLAKVIPEFIHAKVSGSINAPDSLALVMQNPSTQFLSLTVKEELQSIDVSPFHMGHLLDKSVFQLSEGEKQKVNLISNLASNPAALLLDEPLELLDPFEAARFQEILARIKDRAIVFFDKSEQFSAGMRKISLGESTKQKPEAKRNNAGSKRVLGANFSLKRNSFQLNDVSIELHDGEKIALIGRNGSGKSTVLRAMAGMEKLHGKIDLGRKVSFVPQNPSHLFFQETVQAELSDIGNASKLGISYLLHENPAILSKGQQKLVSVATVVPDTIALLDEPTTWLDEGNKAMVYSFINNSKDAMLIATHDPMLLNYCDRVLIVEGGEVHECSSTAINRFFLAPEKS